VRKATTLVNVPEATVHKNDLASPRENDIGSARKLLWGEPISIAEPEQKLSDC
jgi:hypothetical protein